jgi:hypothetical protein
MNGCYEDPAVVNAIMCETNRRRMLMTDAEYWADVQGSLGLVDDLDDEPEIEVPVSTSPCGVCGEQGPCGYDAEGRPMIHAEGLESSE